MNLLPGDVILKHIVCFLNNYLDRYHLALTCKKMFQLITLRDPMINAIVFKDYQRALNEIVEHSTYEDVLDFSCILPDPANIDYVQAACKTTNPDIISYFRLIMDTGIDTVTYDTVVFLHLYDTFNGRIPDIYFKIIRNDQGLAGAYAQLGNYELFLKHFNEIDDNDDTEILIRLAFSAGIGQNKKILETLLSLKV